MTQTVESDKRGFELSSTSAADENSEAVVNLASHSRFGNAVQQAAGGNEGGNDGGGGDGVEIKKEDEGPSQLELLQKRIASLKENACDHLRKYQDMDMQTKQLEVIVRKRNDNYAGPLLTDIQTQVKRLAKVVKLLDRLCTP